MNEETAKVIETIANEIVSMARLVMENSNIGLRDSALRKDIGVEIKSLDRSIVIETIFADYIDYLERGRRPQQGKQPPIDELRDWALARGIPTDNSTLFLISRAIWRNGYEGRPILATLEEEIERKFEEEWADRLFEAITED